MAEFRMPSLGADMDSGVLLEWLVHPGDTVHKGDIVAVVDTQKAAIEVECFADGVIEQLLVEPGTRVPVGDPLAVITTAPGAEPSPAPQVAGVPEPSTLDRGAEPGVMSPLIRRRAEERHLDLGRVRGTGSGGRITRMDLDRAAAVGAPRPPGRVKASPLARRLAAELGVELDQVPGTSASGAISADDVRRAAAATREAPTEAAPPAVSEAAPAAVAGRAQDLRGHIARLMARSKREIPHYYLSETADLGRALAWLHERNRSLPVPQRLVAAVLMLKAAARAAAAVPELNGYWTADGFAPGAGVHLGVAISLREGGLVAPAIHDADRRDVADLMACLRDLVTRTRAGRLRRAEMSDPTITVSSLGEQGVDSITGVIYPPQVALVGFGRISDRPWAVDGLIGIRPVLTMSLAGDHRATDGVTGARYLRTLRELLQHPEDL